MCAIGKYIGKRFAGAGRKTEPMKARDLQDLLSKMQTIHRRRVLRVLLGAIKSVAKLLAIPELSALWGRVYGSLRCAGGSRIWARWKPVCRAKDVAEGGACASVCDEQPEPPKPFDIWRILAKAVTQGKVYFPGRSVIICGLPLMQAKILCATRKAGCRLNGGCGRRRILRQLLILPSITGCRLIHHRAGFAGFLRFSYDDPEITLNSV